jgi:hypothetical protein
VLVQEEIAETDEEHERQNQLERVVQRMKNVELLRAFNSFAEAVEESLRKRQVLQRVKNSWTNSSLAASFEAWVCYLEELSQDRQNLTADSKKVRDILCPNLNVLGRVR